MIVNICATELEIARWTKAIPGLQFSGRMTLKGMIHINMSTPPRAFQRRRTYRPRFDIIHVPSHLDESPGSWLPCTLEKNAVTRRIL